MRRREFIKAGAVAASLSATNEMYAKDCKPPNFFGTFVLVHGANHGAWCWRDVRDRLRAADYQVFTPTLTGLGERSHLLSPDIRLQDHIDDIVNVILNEELKDVVLVGHSYGGTVVTGVCDALEDRISQVIFLDANTPKDGEATIPGLTPERVEQATGEPLVDGYQVPPLPPVRLGIAPEDTVNTEWLNRRLTPHPIATLSEPLQLRNGGCDEMQRTFILTTQKELLRPFALKRLEEIEDDTTWNYRELFVGHDAMITAPCEVTDLLIALANSQEK
jgi:pimeloyl-ACP methyl ester carboxylesterase